MKEIKILFDCNKCQDTGFIYLQITDCGKQDYFDTSGFVICDNCNLGELIKEELTEKAKQKLKERGK